MGAEQAHASSNDAKAEVRDSPARESEAPAQIVPAETESTAIRVLVSGQPPVFIELSAIANAIPAVLDRLNKPKSLGTKILKDYMPALTPIAAVFVSWLAFYYANSMKTADEAKTSAETLGTLVTEVASQPDEHAKTVEAMKLAAYGEQALPAVKIVLGATNRADRAGAVQVAKQMYIAETVNRQELVREMLKYFDNAALRIGVLEWFASIETLNPRPSGDPESEPLLKKLTQTFGKDGANCSKQDQNMARAAAHFLSAWSAQSSMPLVEAMIQKCPFPEVRAQLQDIKAWR